MDNTFKYSTVFSVNEIGNVIKNLFRIKKTKM